MRLAPRPDDFTERREHLRTLSDDELHAYFWQLARQVVAPLVEEARTHTTPAIERSVLLRMGLSSVEARSLVRRMADGGLLGHGAGRLLVEHAQRRGTGVRDAARQLIAGEGWEDLRP
jgi:D-ornithine 4,5-aminomutase subunit alpha